MRFPRAHEGVRLILLAEILSLIVVAVQLGNAIAAMLPDTGSMFFIVLRGVTLMGTVTSGLVAIACLALRFVGMATAKTDEPRFGTAMVITIISCAVTLVLAFTMVFAMVITADYSVEPPVIRPISGIFTGVTAIISNVLACTATILIASGVVRLARKLGDEATAASGRRFQRVVAAICGVSVAVSVISILVRWGGPGYFYDWTTVLSALTACVSAAVNIRFLAKAKTMLAR